MDSERVAFWAKNHRVEFMGATEAVPFLGHEHLFDGKDVLEIGPGEGRQFKVVAPRARSVWIADISQAVLDRPEYAACAGRALIRDFENRIVHLYFDIVHFWYVLAHVRSEELRDFAAFVSAHVQPGGGRVLFNAPRPGAAPDCYADDGMRTTPHSLEDIVKAFADAGIEVAELAGGSPGQDNILMSGRRT